MNAFEANEDVALNDRLLYPLVPTQSLYQGLHHHHHQTIIIVIIINTIIMITVTKITSSLQPEIQSRRNKHFLTNIYPRSSGSLLELRGLPPTNPHNGHNGHNGHATSNGVTNNHCSGSKERERRKFVSFTVSSQSSNLQIVDCLNICFRWSLTVLGVR